MTPLGDLHRHLEGSIRPATSIEFAARAGIHRLPAQWRAALVAAEREEGLLPYLAKIENATALVRTLDDWRRVTTEAITDAARDGLSALELRFSPQFIAGVTGLDADDVIEAVSDAAFGTGLPIEVGLIGIIVRDAGPDSAVDQVRRLLRHQSGPWPESTSRETKPDTRRHFSPRRSASPTTTASRSRSTRARQPARAASGMPCAWARDASGMASAAPRIPGSWRTSPPPVSPSRSPSPATSRPAPPAATPSTSSRPWWRQASASRSAPTTPPSATPG